MIVTNTPIQPFLPGFFQTWLFHPLPQKQQQQVASELKICRFKVGQFLQKPGELPSSIHYIVRGNVRILGAGKEQPTLTMLGEGSVVGWESLIRRVSVGSTRAALNAGETNAEVITLALSADCFEGLMPQILPVLESQVSVVELFDVLTRWSSSTTSTQPEVQWKRPVREITSFILRNQLAVIKHIHPVHAYDRFPSSGVSRSIPTELSPNYLWFVSGGAPLNRSIGERVEPTEPLVFTHATRFPARLLGIDRDFIIPEILNAAAFNLPAIDSGGTRPRVEVVDESVDAAIRASHRQTTAPRALNGSPHGSLKVASTDELPAIDPGSEISSQRSPTSSQRQAYPIWRSPAPEVVEDVVACFGMVCERLQVPYRPDSLRRWLVKQALDLEDDPLDLYNRIAQALGFDAQIVEFTTTAGGLNRIRTPALIQYQDVLTVLYDVTPSTAVLGSPRTGLLRLAPEKLATRLAAAPGNQGQRGRAIALDQFTKPVSKRFGFHWFLPLITAQRGVLIQVLLASMVIQILTVGNPLLIQQVIDNVIISANHGAMPMFGLLMLLFAGLEGGLTISRRYLLASTTQRIDLHLGIEIIRHMLHLPLHFFEKRPVGELSSRISELENIRQFLTDTAITVVLDVVFSIIYIGVMFLYSARLTLCVLMTVPVIVISTLVLARVQRKLIEVRADRGAKVQSYLVEVLSGIPAVKAQHMESLVEATWREKYVQYLTSDFTTSTIGTIFYSFTQFLNTASSLVVLWVGAIAVLEGELTLGGLIAFRILTGYVTGPLLRLASLWQRFQETALSMNLLAEIAEFPTEELPQEQSRMLMPAIAGKVEYQDISFGFQPGKLQLSSVSLTINPGTFVGIVGQSGSGKSTLMKLLPRLYMPQSGKILVDDQDVSRVNLSSLRSQIGIVSQEPVLFQGSIRDNIALFEDLSDEEVVAAAQIAHAHDFIMQLPDGYNTTVGEKGGTLSGGQRQRIAIARVVARNPRLLIFDEATSALDYETERQVCENLMRHFQTQTCFFITHRLNTIVRADRILLMQSGIIAEQGSHTELMNRRQLYYCLFAQQSKEG